MSPLPYLNKIWLTFRPFVIEDLFIATRRIYDSDINNGKFVSFTNFEKKNFLPSCITYNHYAALHWYLPKLPLNFHPSSNAVLYSPGNLYFIPTCRSLNVGGGMYSGNNDS